MNKTDRVMKWIVGIAAAAALNLAGWNLQATVGHNTRLSVIEERTGPVMTERLKNIEDKLDRLIERR